MSRVDTSFPPSERKAYLDDIQTHLPAFLSSATTEHLDPVGDLSDLLNLTRRDLERVVAAHIGLSSEARDLVASLPRGLRAPITATIRQRVATQAVRGSIDWGATVAHRARTGGAETEYVVRPARRVFDTPENRTLAYVLERLDLALRRVAPAEIDQQAGVNNAGWFSELTANASRLRQARRHHWLRDVPAERPDSRARKRLASARASFYKVVIPGALDMLVRYTEDPSPADVSELLARRYFEPERDWQLFELVVALRIARAFGTRSARKRKGRLLVGVGASPYARYVMPDGAEVRLWYQAWPSDSGTSLHGDARDRYEIASGPLRPDLVAQLRRNGETQDAVLLELKATRSASYLGQGLGQLLGYLKDRPSLFTAKPSGWMVAPVSSAFTTNDPAGTELWVVGADVVAARLVERFGY